jgi:hypothetical protein
MSSTTVSDGFGFFKLPTANVGDTLLASMLGYETSGWIYDGASYVDIPLTAGVDLGSSRGGGTEVGDAVFSIVSIGCAIPEPKGVGQSGVLQSF